MRRFRWVFFAAPVVIVLLVAATVYAASWWRRDDKGVAAQVVWQPPQQTLLSPMRVPPVPGWRANAVVLGMPGSGQFATDDQPSQSTPFIGHVDERAYFVGRSRAGSAWQWWVAGVDAHSGARLFAPTAIDIAGAPPECFLNGPDMVLCLRDGVAWVVDTHTGRITHTGPTDLRSDVTQVGRYAVAQDPGKGVSGIGPTAELTWFVPGDGSVHQGRGVQPDPAPPFATQATAERGSDTDVVFSLVDGTVVTPAGDATLRPLGATVYSGGFAQEMTSEPNRRLYEPSEVWFYDQSGNRVGQVDVAGELATDSPDAPIVGSSSDLTVYSVGGQPVARLPISGAGRPARLIGSTLYVFDTENFSSDRWQAYDLPSGQKGAACAVDMQSSLLGSDGSVGVFGTANAGADVLAKGWDLAACAEIWRLPKKPDSFGRVWRVGDTLVRLSDDGTELMSLVGPAN